VRFRPIHKTRLSQVAAQQIKAFIQNENLKPGEKLPSERQFIDLFRISRTSVREALRILELMGFIKIKPGSGSFVQVADFDLIASNENGSIPETYVDSPILSMKKRLRDLFEVRLMIEPNAAALAAEHAGKNSLTAMHNILADLETKIEGDDVFGMIISDAEFHRQISRSTQNETIVLTMETILRILFEEWRSIFIVPISRIKNFIEHERILEAIEKHDPDKAKKTMRMHLEKALNRHSSSLINP